jgi:hypothetical protein
VRDAQIAKLVVASVVTSYEVFPGAIVMQTKVTVKAKTSLRLSLSFSQGISQQNHD